MGAASGVCLSVDAPCVAVACRLVHRRCAALLYGQVERLVVLATRCGGAVICVGAAGGVGLSVPCVAVAGCLAHRRVVALVDGQVQRVDAVASAFNGVLYGVRVCARCGVLGTVPCVAVAVGGRDRGGCVGAGGVPHGIEGHVARYGHFRSVGICHIAACRCRPSHEVASRVGEGVGVKGGCFAAAHRLCRHRAVAAVGVEGDGVVRQYGEVEGCNAVAASGRGGCVGIGVRCGVGCAVPLIRVAGFHADWCRFYRTYHVQLNQVARTAVEGLDKIPSAFGCGAYRLAVE